EKLSKIRSKKLLVVLDCCHAGGQAQLKDGGSYAIPAKVLDELAEHSGRVIIASSYQDEKSYAGKPLSFFTQAFLEGLAGCGSPVKDGYSRVLDIYTWAARMVPNRTNDKQHPMIKVRDMGDNFPVAWYAGGGETPHGSRGVKINPTDDKSKDETGAKNKILSNYKKNLLLIETRMSEYVAFTDIPLQLISSKQVIESCIKELES
ncbi:MAG: caspase family protein, partial [Thiotrichaceae bacterium]